MSEIDDIRAERDQARAEVTECLRTLSVCRYEGSLSEQVATAVSELGVWSAREFRTATERDQARADREYFHGLIHDDYASYDDCRYTICIERKAAIAEQPS